MKKKTLLLALSLLTGMAGQAQPQLMTESPWTGQALPEETDTFYLYNVETGLWFQNNRKELDFWTTYAQADVHGFDVILSKLPDGGYQINPRFGNNHSVNGTNTTACGYLDTGQDLTAWEFTPSSLVENGYEITCDNGNGVMQVAWDEENSRWYLDFIMGDGVTWQLVSKAERMADLETASKDNPKDATWLIQGWDFANADERNAAWVNEITGSGSGVAFNQGWRPNRAAECWSRGVGEYYQVIKDLPNGTYGLTVQGYYRDGSTSGVAEKHDSGTEVIRGFYFANDMTAPFMSICDNGLTETIPDVYPDYAGTYVVPGDGGQALPRASNGFWLGYYQNPELKVVVTDGTLRIGVRKDSDVGDDWLVFDNFNLTYYGSDVDIDEVKENLKKTIDEAEAYEGSQLAALAKAIADGKAALETTDAKAIAVAATTIQSALAVTKAMNVAVAGADEIKAASEGQWTPPFFFTAYDAAQAVLATEDVAELQAAANDLQNAVNSTNSAIENYAFLKATATFAEEEGVAADIISAARTKADNAAELRDVTDALGSLRVARKLLKVETHPDVFKGNVPSAGDPEMRDNDFYLYNVGAQRFLCGGEDWGTHTVVGFPGQLCTLVAHEETDSFVINTHLPNGGESEYLGYNGYVDTPARDPWCFKPVEGKPGVYTIARSLTDEEGNVTDGYLGYQAGSYCIVHTDMKGADDPNNQWKLVSKADREDLLLGDDVDATHPVDASFYISCPNFNQRDDASLWICNQDDNGNDTGTIWGRGNNYPDFAYESWNKASFNLTQDIYDLPVGWYKISCTGYYRDGDHANQILEYAEGKALDENYEPVQAAELYTSDTSEDAYALLPNITAGVDLMPGLGNRSTARRYNEEDDTYGDPQYIGEFPYWISEAVNWFQMGFYKTEILTEVTNPADGLLIAISKERDGVIGDWTVVDNFRLTYYGVEKPENWRSGELDGVKDVISATKGDGKVYNLQGIQIQGRLKSGIYVKNGHKVLIK